MRCGDMPVQWGTVKHPVDFTLTQRHARSLSAIVEDQGYHALQTDSRPRRRLVLALPCLSTLAAFFNSHALA